MSFEFDAFEDVDTKVAAPTVTPSRSSSFDFNAFDTTPTLAEDRLDPVSKQNSSWTMRGAALGVGRTLGRMAIRPFEDVYNAANEVFGWTEKAEWDEYWFGEPVNKIEDFTASMGSYLLTFLVPGGLIAKGVVGAGKAAGGARAAQLVSTISKTAKGRKLVKFSAIAGQGSIAGAVADYLNTDTGDEVGLDAVKERLTETWRGAIIGAGLNLGGFGLKRFVTSKLNVLRAQKKVLRAAEGKGDPVLAQDALAKALRESKRLKSESLDEILSMDSMAKGIDIDDPIQDAIQQKIIKDAPVLDDIPVGVDIDDIQKELLEGKEKLRWLINNGNGLAEQLNTLVGLTKDWNRKADKAFTKITSNLHKATKGKLDSKQIEALKTDLLGMEKRLEQHKFLMEMRAVAGNHIGKSLRAFRADNANFSKPFQYREDTRKRIAAIDEMLDFIRGTRTGKYTNESLVKELQSQVSQLDSVAKTGKLDTLYRRALASNQDHNYETIWGQYKKSIADDAIARLTPSKDTQKALLDLFSNDVGKVIEDLLPKVSSKKAVRSALDKVQQVMDNPEKLRESMEATITELSKSDLPEEIIDAAIKSLEQPLNTIGKRLFSSTKSGQEMVAKVVQEELTKVGVKLRKVVAEGNEAKVFEEIISSISKRVELDDEKKAVLIAMLREQFGVMVTDIKDKTVRDFITSEIHSKFMLSGEIADLEDMKSKPLNEIRDYLISVAKQRKQTPEDIKFLRRQRDLAKQELEKRVDNAYFVELLQRLNKMQVYQTSTLSNWELALGLIEQWRYNQGMLGSPRTWFIGPVSSVMQLTTQPFHRALKVWHKADAMQKAGDLGKDISKTRLALTELVSSYEYFNNIEDQLRLMFHTWRNGGFSVFNPKSIQRHAEYVQNAMDKSDPTQLLFKDRATLKELIKMYGGDQPETRGMIRKFFEDIHDGTPTNGFGKAMELMFSVSQRVMGSFDDAVTLVGTRRALRARGTQEGLLKGLEGDALEKHVTDYMQEAIRREGGYPVWAGLEELAEVEQLGLAVSFRSDYTDKFLSSTARSFAHWSRNGPDAAVNPAKIMARWSVPFIKTPTAILEFTVENLPGLAQSKALLHKSRLSPLHMQQKRVQESLEDAINIKNNAVTQSQRKAAEEQVVIQKELLEGIKDKLYEQHAEINATAITSSFIAIGMITLVNNAKITGTGAYLPDDMRENMRRNGFKFQHIEISGQQVDYSRLEPWSPFISAYADYFAFASLTAQNPELEEYLPEGAAIIQSYMIEQMGNKYFVKGLFDLMRPFVDEDYKPGQLLSGYAESLSPRVIRELRTVNRDFEKQYNGWKDKFFYRAFGEHTGQKLRNVLGEAAPRQYTPEGWFNYASPISISEAKSDPILKEISGLFGTIGSLKRATIDKVNTRNYRNEAGQTLYDAWMDEVDHTALRVKLQRLFNSSRYKNAHIFKEDGVITRTDLVNEQIRRFHNDAWERVKRNRKYHNFYNEEGISWVENTDQVNIKGKDAPTTDQLLGF